MATGLVYGKCDWDKRSGQIGRKSAINVQMCQPRHTLRFLLRLLIDYICNTCCNAIIQGYIICMIGFSPFLIPKLLSKLSIIILMC